MTSSMPALDGDKLKPYKPILVALHALPNVGRKRLFQVMLALADMSGDMLTGATLTREVETDRPSPTLAFYLERVHRAWLTSQAGAIKRYRDTERLRQALTEHHVFATQRHLRQRDINVVMWGEKAYPEALAHIPDPPPILYVKGKHELLSTESLAVVGTRRPTPYGMRAARELSQALALAGFTIVSGLAEGIDAIAHRAALSIHGRTVAVLGSSHDHIYPRAHEPLYTEIVEEGAVVSEYPLGTRPSRGLFPERNRLISGLARGVLVVEGHLGSGSMITASHALEQGREVFAVPGPIFSAQSAGPHQLIQEGAKLVRHPADILDELRQGSASWQEKSGIDKSREEKEERNKTDASTTMTGRESLPHELDILLKETKHFDDLVLHTSLAPDTLLALLTPLVLNGTVEKLPGHRYRLRS